MQQTRNDVSSSIAGYTFKFWNLAEAKFAIKHCLQKSSELSFSENDIKFLSDLKEHIVAFIDVIIAIQTWSPLITELSVAEAINEFRKKIDDSIETIEAWIEKTSSEIVNKELNTHINDPKKLDYVNLLKDILYCIQGLKVNIEDIKKIKEEKLSIIKQAGISAEKLGGRCIPISQAIDPLHGAIYSDNKFLPADGHCAGIIINWGKEIREKKPTSLTFALGSKSAKRQKHQREYKKDFTSKDIPYSSNFQLYISNLLQNVEKENVYFMAISSDNASHALGIRRITPSGQIEFLDPNFGLFCFDNDQNFIDWFSRLILSYRMKGHFFDDLQLGVMGKQFDSTKSYFPNIVNQSSNYDSYEGFKDFVSGLQKLFHEEKNAGFKKITKNQFKKMIIDVLPSYLNYIKKVEDLHEMKKLLMTLSFLPESSLLNLFNRPPQLPKEVLDLIDNREKNLLTSQAQSQPVSSVLESNTSKNK